MRVAGAVLAGGKSSRLGRDKSLLKVRGRTLTALMAGKLLKAGCFPVYVVGPAKAYGLPGGVTRIGERYRGRGPMSGIEAALRAAEGPVLVTACDFPKLSASLLSRLRRAHQAGSKLSAARSPRGWEPLLAVYGSELLPELRRRLRAGKGALMPLLKLHARKPVLRLRRRIVNLNDARALKALKIPPVLTRLS